MTAITMRLSDEKHERLKNLAATRGVSINYLLNEAASRMLAEFDAETRFKTRVTKGNVRHGLNLLDKALMS